MRSIVIALVALALLVGFAPDAHAHGGEDHGAPEPATPVASGGQRTAFGQTRELEVLIRLDPARPGDLRVFVADWATNAPVAGATVALEIQASPVVKVTASESWLT